MSIYDTNEYQDSLHFCSNNPAPLVARQMACDLLRIKDLEACRKALENLVIHLRPLEDNGGFNVPGLATLNGARKALENSSKER